jgi:tetratricopeptide (TPR) repeat protein
MLAGAYNKLGQYEEGVVTFKRALQIYGPNHLSAHVGLAATYSALGREVEARAEGAEVLRIDPKFSVEQYLRSNPGSPAYKDRLTKALRNAGLN